MVKAHSESSAMRLKSFRLVFDVFRRSWVRFPRYMLFFWCFNSMVFRARGTNIQHIPGFTDHSEQCSV